MSTNETTPNQDNPNLDLGHDDLLEPVKPEETTIPQFVPEGVSVESEEPPLSPEEMIDQGVNLYEQFFTNFQENEDIRKETLEGLQSIMALGEPTDQFLTRIMNKHLTKEEKQVLLEELEIFIRDGVNETNNKPLHVYAQLYARNLINEAEVGDMKHVVYRFDALKMFARVFSINTVFSYPDDYKEVNCEEITDQMNNGLLANFNDVLYHTLAAVQSKITEEDVELLYPTAVFEQNINKFFDYLETLIAIRPVLVKVPYFHDMVNVARVYWLVLAEEADVIYKADNLSIHQAVEHAFDKRVEKWRVNNG